MTSKEASVEAFQSSEIASEVLLMLSSTMVLQTFIDHSARQSASRLGFLNSIILKKFPCPDVLTRGRTFSSTASFISAAKTKRPQFNLTMSASQSGPPSVSPMGLLERDVHLVAKDGEQVAAYFVQPKDSSVSMGRGVLLMSDILGYINEETRNVARRLALEGFPTGAISSQFTQTFVLGYKC